jgi:hypothetical protein
MAADVIIRAGRAFIIFGQQPKRIAKLKMKVNRKSSYLSVYCNVALEYMPLTGRFFFEALPFFHHLFK